MSGNHKKLRTPNWWRKKLDDEYFRSNGDKGRFKKSFSKIECDRWEEGMTHSELLDIYEEHWDEYLNSSDGDAMTKLEMSELMQQEADEERLAAIMEMEPWQEIDAIFEEHQLPIDELNQYLKLKKKQHRPQEQDQKQIQEMNDKLGQLKNRDGGQIFDLG